MITTAAFWKGALERLVKTFIQAFLAAAMVGVGSDVANVGLTDLNWLGALNIAGLAALISLATSVLNASFVAGVPATVVDSDGNVVGNRAPIGPDVTSRTVQIEADRRGPFSDA